MEAASHAVFATVQGASTDLTQDGRTIFRRSQLTTGETAIDDVERGVGETVQ
ncbi:MAG: hypothetical protein AAF602_31640 [Myxococcota bacterium]